MQVLVIVKSLRRSKIQQHATKFSAWSRTDAYRDSYVASFTKKAVSSPSPFQPSSKAESICVNVTRGRKEGALTFASLPYVQVMILDFPKIWGNLLKRCDAVKFSATTICNQRWNSVTRFKRELARVTKYSLL